MTKNIIEEIKKKISLVRIKDRNEYFYLAPLISNIMLENNKLSIIFTFENSDTAQRCNKEIMLQCTNIINEFDKDLETSIVFTSHHNMAEQNTKENINKRPFNPSGIEGVKNIIAIAAGKGGVGKSTLATNLAIALAKKGLNVGLVDTDIHGPSLGKMMGINEKPCFQNKKIIPHMKFGVKTISISSLIDNSDKAIIWRGPMVSKALSQLMAGTKWSADNWSTDNKGISGKIKDIFTANNELDYLIVDFPPGTSDIQISMVQQYKFSTAIMITTPQDVSLLDVTKAIDLFRKANIHIMGIVKNMAYFIPEGSSKKLYPFGRSDDIDYVDNFCKNNKIPLLAELPIDSRISSQGDLGEPFASKYENDNISKIFADIAQKLIGKYE